MKKIKMSVRPFVASVSWHLLAMTPPFLRKFWRTHAEEIRKLKFLWKHVKPDCRGALIKEFIFDSGAFEERYVHELQFQGNLQRMELGAIMHNLTRPSKEEGE